MTSTFAWHDAHWARAFRGYAALEKGDVRWAIGSCIPSTIRYSNLAGNAKGIPALGQASVWPPTMVQVSSAGAIDEQLGENVEETLQQSSPRATIGSASPRVDEQEEACDGIYSSY